jgi:hypothetical protein
MSVQTLQFARSRCKSLMQPQNLIVRADDQMGAKINRRRYMQCVCGPDAFCLQFDRSELEVDCGGC